MRYFWPVYRIAFLTICLLFFACGNNGTTVIPSPRTITVTIRNLDTVYAVHIYIGEGESNAEHLVLFKGNIVTMVFAPRIGYIIIVCVAQDKPGSLPFHSLGVRVN